MEYQTITTIMSTELRTEIINQMYEWVGTTYFNCRYNKKFAIADVVLNNWGIISFRAMSCDGKIEDLTNEKDMKYNESMGCYLNIDKP